MKSGPVTQRKECLPSKQVVAGSTPAGPAKKPGLIANLTPAQLKAALAYRGDDTVGSCKPKRVRTAYMREYMRRRRSGMQTRGVIKVHD